MKTLDLGKHSLYKMSHGEAAKHSLGRTMHSAEYFKDNNWIVLHKDTGRKQGFNFINKLKIGDYVYVCHGSNELSYFAEITSLSNKLPVSAREYVNDSNWVYRKVQPIFYPKDTSLVELIKIRKAWMPSGNSTLWKVPDTEINYFNEVIGISKYNIKITNAAHKNPIYATKGRKRGAADLEKTGYIRKITEHELYVKEEHKQIQKRLKNYLLSLGHKFVICEENYVDQKQDIDGVITFYEIKPYKKPILCIRESIGQLIEYRYRAEATLKPQHLISIGINPLDEESKEFLFEIQKQIPEFSYKQFDLTKNKLID